MEELATMDKTLIPAAGVMGSLEQTAKSTLMTVPTPINVRMVEPVKMISTLSAVTVYKAIQEITVKLILMSAAQIHVRMVEPVKMISTPSVVSVL